MTSTHMMAGSLLHRMEMDRHLPVGEQKVECRIWPLHLSHGLLNKAGPDFSHIEYQWLRIVPYFQDLMPKRLLWSRFQMLIYGGTGCILSGGSQAWTASLPDTLVSNDTQRECLRPNTDFSPFSLPCVCWCRQVVGAGMGAGVPLVSLILRSSEADQEMRTIEWYRICLSVSEWRAK